MSATPVRWLFGYQLGPHFLDDRSGQVLMVESKAVFRRHRSIAPKRIWCCRRCGIARRRHQPRNFATWAAGRGQKRLLMEDFYPEGPAAARRTAEGAEPVGGPWNYDHENREAPPKGADTLGVPEPIWPEKDEIDHEVCADLDR